MEAIIGRLCDRLEAGGTRLGTALASVWRGGRPPTPPSDPEAQATAPVSIKYLSLNSKHYSKAELYTYVQR